MDPRFLDAFLWRWSEAIAWCAPRASRKDPVNSLRTPELRPGLLRHRASQVFDVQEARSNLLKESATSLPEPANQLENGRLLVYFPDLNHHRGGPRIATGDFFDHNGVPPWDTWVEYFEEDDRHAGEYLVAWIPLEFVDLANRGIEIDKDASVDWLVQRGVPLTCALQERALLR